jgi:hypothetical protein
MDSDLTTQVETIETKADFVAFVRTLRQDFRTNDDDWQHSDIAAYLEAIAAWTEEAMDNYYTSRGQEVPQQPDWKVFANILIAASVYE